MSQTRVVWVDKKEFRGLPVNISDNPNESVSLSGPGYITP